MTEGLIIEVGHGSFPTGPKSLREDLRPKEGKIFYFDKRFDHSRTMKQHPAMTKFGKMVTAEGERLPLNSDSVDLVYASNLFGAHEMEYFDSGFERETIDTASLVKEWSRVCKPGGKVVVHEDASPADREALIRHFKQAGFVLKEKHLGEDRFNIYKGGSSSSSQKEPFNDDRYSLVFEKKQVGD